MDALIITLLASARHRADTAELKLSEQTRRADSFKHQRDSANGERLAAIRVKGEAVDKAARLERECEGLRRQIADLNHRHLREMSQERDKANEERLALNRERDQAREELKRSRHLGLEAERNLVEALGSLAEAERKRDEAQEKLDTLSESYSVLAALTNRIAERLSAAEIEYDGCQERAEAAERREGAAFKAGCEWERTTGTPAATHEEWSAAYWVEFRGTRELRLIGTAGDREHAEETRDDCAMEDPTTRFFLARRPVFPWTPTDEN